MWTRIKYFSRETLISLRRNVLMSVAGILTVAVSLSLFGGILLLSKWVDHGTERIKGGVTLEIFMNVKATNQQVDDVRKQLEKDPQVKSFRFLNHDDAFKVYKNIVHNDPNLVGSITPQDLPESFRVAPKRAELTETVRQEYRTQQGVNDVATPGDALKTILDVTKKIRLGFYVVITILLLSSLFLIVNTIRLATFARRREIEVMKLVGASNWFVRIPFVAESLVQGLVGAGIAISAVLALKHFGFDEAFRGGTDSLFSEFYVTSGDAWLIAGLVLFVGVVIGVVGATVGLRRFLKT